MIGSSSKNVIWLMDQDEFKQRRKKFKLIKKNFLLLFETPRDLQPIMRFNIISRSKCYSLFPILSGLIEPSLRNFRIPLLNGLFSPVGIGICGSIPSLRTVLESFLPHTAPQWILLVSLNWMRFLIDLYNTVQGNQKRLITWVSNFPFDLINNQFQFYLFSYLQKKA